MTLIKWILGFIVTLVVLIIAAIIIVPQVVDPNDYRDDISTLVRKQTGRDLVINGDLTLSVFPWIGIKTEGVTFSQPRHLSEAFGDGNMLEVSSTEIKVKALPLLKSLTADKKDIQVATIVLKQPKVNIITTRQGLTSFDGLTGDEGNSSEVVKGDKESAEESAAKAGIALVVQGVNLEDGEIVWDDRQAKQRYEVNNLQLQTGNLLGEDLVDIKTSAEVIDSSSPDQISFSLEGQARLDIESLAAVANDLELVVERGDIEASLVIGQLGFVQGGLISIKQVKSDVSYNDEEVGPAKVKLLVPDIAYDQASSGLTLDSLVANGSFQERPVSLETTELTFNLNSQGLAVKNLDIVFDGVEASIDNLVGTSVIDKPGVAGELTVKPLNLRSVLKSFAVDFEPALASALTKFSLQTQFSGDFSTDEQGNGGRLSLKALRAELDESALKGDFAVDNVFGSPNIDFKLALDQFNVDNYSPAAEVTGASSGSAEPEAEAIDASSMAVPLAIFKQFKANGGLEIGSLVAGGAKVTNVAVDVVTKGDTTVIKPSAKLYEGTYDGAITYQETASGGKLTVKQSLKNVLLEPLLTDTDTTDQLSGLANIDVDVVVAEKNGVQTNQGVIKLNARNGAIKGVDLKKLLDGAQEQYNKYKEREVEEGASDSNDETSFAEMGGTFELNNFVLTNSDFALKAPLFRVKGEGVIDLAQQQLDYDVDVSVVKSSDGQGGESLDKLEGATIPVKFYGSLTAPKYKIDISSLFKAAAKAKLKEKLGIETDKELSTKELLKQKLTEKYITNSDDADPESADNAQEQPGNSSEQAAPTSETQEEEPKTKEQKKKEAKDELKKKLLKSLFD